MFSSGGGSAWYCSCPRIPANARPDRASVARWRHRRCVPRGDRAQPTWEYSSRENDTLGPEVDYAQLPFDGLAKFYTDHAIGNIPLSICALARLHDVEVACSTTVLDSNNAYWKTGDVPDGDYGKIVRVSTGLLLSPVGHLEQLLCAGIATLFGNGAKSSLSDEEGNGVVPGLLVAYSGPQDATVWFKFEGQTVCMQMMMGGKPTILLVAGSW